MPRAAALVLALALAACGGDEREAEPPELEPITTAGETGCRDVPGPTPKAPPVERPPSAILSTEKTYRVLVETSCGTFTITLEPERSPKATASFVALVRRDFYDRTVFHRIVPGFVVQAGDPTATGTGGPGYTTVDTPASGTRYTRGVVAMAKAGAEPRGAAGSQFFIVTADDAALPPDYAVIGRVTEGMDVVDRIGLLGDPNTELPTQPVVIDDVVLRVS